MIVYILNNYLRNVYVPLIKILNIFMYLLPTFLHDVTAQFHKEQIQYHFSTWIDILRCWMP